MKSMLFKRLEDKTPSVHLDTLLPLNLQQNDAIKSPGKKSPTKRLQVNGFDQFVQNRRESLIKNNHFS